MPQATNITVKKADNTDVTFSVLAPAAGDNSSAIFRHESVANRDLRSTLAIRSRGGNAGVRRVEGTVSVPVVRAVDGVDTKKANIPVDFSIAVPGIVTDAEIQDAVVVATNLISSALVRACMQTGYAPT